jgi:quinol monooxygenase YgiN
MKFRLLAGLVFTAAMALCQTPAMLRLITVKVKPGYDGEFRDLQAKVTAAYIKQNTSMRYVWEPFGFGDQSVWYGVTSVKSLGELDGSPMAAVMGEKEYQQFLQRSARVIDGVAYSILEPRPEITIPSKTKLDGIWQLTILRVKPGMEARLEQLVAADLIPALKSSGVKAYHVYRVTYGDELGTYYVSTPIENLAALDRGTVAAGALGKEAYAKFRDKLAELVTSIQTNTIRAVPSLSYDKVRQ